MSINKKINMRSFSRAGRLSVCAALSAYVFVAGCSKTEPVSPIPVSAKAEAGYEITEYETTAELVDESAKYSTPEQENIYKANRIKREYLIEVRYANEVKWENDNGDNKIHGIYDAALISQRLDAIIECLQDYPVELFYDLNRYSPIVINLVNDLDGPDGFTDANEAGNIQIALSCNNSLSYYKLAFHHELFHFIEYSMSYCDKGCYELLTSTSLYNDISLYSTEGNAGTIYDVDADIYQQYFSSAYAKTSDVEDRAELFAYYMGKTTKDCMKICDTPISCKMIIISQAIREFCPSLALYDKGVLAWEQKITY